MDLRASLSEAFLTHLVDRGHIDSGAALQLLDAQRRQTPQIGKVALEEGVLTVKQVFRVLHDQADTGLRFGEQAIALGYLDERELTRLLDLQGRRRPSVGRLMIDAGIATEAQVSEWHADFVAAMSEALRP